MLIPTQIACPHPFFLLHSHSDLSFTSCLLGIDDRKFAAYWHQDELTQTLQSGFSSSETDYCFSKARPFESLAGRWLIKQAAAQLSSIPWTLFEIRRSAEGVPSLYANHPLYTQFRWQISITHDQHWAYGLVLRGPH